MKPTLDDVVSYDSAPVRPRRRRRRGLKAPFTPSRRDFIHGSLVVGGGVALSVLGLFPTSRSAYAGHPDDQIKQDCSGLEYAANDNCDGCNTVGTPSIKCCCADSGWHKHDGTNWKLRPNDCTNFFDGWKWGYQPCCANGCREQKWRCHDGYKCENPPCSENEWIPSVCRHRLSADSCCPQCLPPVLC